MPTTDQNIQPERYQAIPRVLVFPFCAESVLLLKLSPKNGKTTRWTGRFNGPGGHVERGEDLLSAARRELLEETGLSGSLTLAGVVMVDVYEQVGIALNIFRADHVAGELISSSEGTAEWVPVRELNNVPLVEDVAIFLQRIQQMQPGDPPFMARSFYDEHENLRVVFS